MTVKVKDEESCCQMVWELIDIKPCGNTEKRDSYMRERFKGAEFSSIVTIDGQGQIKKRWERRVVSSFIKVGMPMWKRKNPEINFVKALSAVCAVLLWRNAFLSVFDLEALAKSNRTKRNHFCRDCREFCGIYFVDCGIQSKEAARNCLFGYFCTVYICCMRAKISAAMGVVDVGFAAVLYGTCCAMEGCKAKQVFRSLVLISAVFGIACGISVFAGKQIDQIRVGENGFYQETRQKKSERT